MELFCGERRQSVTHEALDPTFTSCTHKVLDVSSCLKQLIKVCRVYARHRVQYALLLKVKRRSFVLGGS